VAAEAEVELLALTHISSRYLVRDLRKEAEAAFERTIIPRDFDSVSIPLPERGGPEHVRGAEPPTA
jgi:ribonuclease Z